MAIDLVGKRYVELNPTTSLLDNSLLSIYKAGNPENNSISFTNLKKNIGIAGLKDLHDVQLEDGQFLKYVGNKFNAEKLAPLDIPTLPISKITNLQSILNSKENSFQKGSITSSTILIQNGVGRLFGGEPLEMEINLSAIENGLVPRTRKITFKSSDESVSFNGSFEETYALSNDLTIDVKSNGVGTTYTASNGVRLTDSNFSVDTTVLRTGSSSQTRLGLLYLRRGESGQEVEHLVFDYPDNNGEDYNLKLHNNAEGNNVRWYLKQKSVVGLNKVNLNVPVLGFQNGVVLFGTTKYPTPGLQIEDYYNSQTNPPVRHPLTIYNEGDFMNSGRIFVGKRNLVGINPLDPNVDLWVEREIFSKNGNYVPTVLKDSPFKKIDIWRGSKAQLDALGSLNPNVIYFTDNIVPGDFKIVDKGVSTAAGFFTVPGTSGTNAFNLFRNSSYSWKKNFFGSRRVLEFELSGHMNIAPNQVLTVGLKMGVSRFCNIQLESESQSINSFWNLKFTVTISSISEIKIFGLLIVNDKFRLNTVNETFNMDQDLALIAEGVFASANSSNSIITNQIYVRIIS